MSADVDGQPMKRVSRAPRSGHPPGDHASPLLERSARPHPQFPGKHLFHPCRGELKPLASGAKLIHCCAEIMNIGTLARSLAVLLVSTIIGICEDVSEKKKDEFPKWAFCMAYEVRDPDARDSRPIDPNAEKDPFNGDTWIPQGLINDRNIVDVAALTARIVKAGMLKQQAALAVVRGATGETKYPVSECYVPHHLFVFYDYEGHPVAAISVCFSCNRVKMTPKVGGGRGPVDPFETGDLAGLAKIATEAGLDLKPFPSLDLYLKRLDQQTGRGHPAARPVSKSGGEDTPQSESKSAPR